MGSFVRMGVQWIAIVVVAAAFGCGGDSDSKPSGGGGSGDADAGDVSVGDDTDRADTRVAEDTRRDDTAEYDTSTDDTDPPDSSTDGEICDDGVDNDDNGDVDCRDPDCSTFDRCTFTAMAGGRNHVCGVVDSGEVVCWGRNAEGQLGNGETSDTPSGPVFVDGVEGAVDIAVGLSHSCARLAGGGLRCWGENDRGQLGDDSFASSPFPVEVAGVDNARDVTAGGKFTCAVVGEGGDLWCWGDNTRKQSGGTSGDRRRTPGGVAGLTHRGMESVSAGIEHACALRLVDPDADPAGQGRYARCWGANDLGQLGWGREDVDEFVLPSPVKADDTNVTDFVPGSLTAGQNSTCAIREGGSVWCWGDGTAGHFGSVELAGEPQYQAVEVPGLGDAQRLWHELFHVCAERASGRVVCWGSNSGQPFHEQSKVFLDPVLLGDVQNPRDLGPGDQFTCWATATGEGYCQGVGGAGQLGRPIGSSSTAVPQRVVPEF